MQRFRIKRELSTPYNPQQNEVAEWKNRTIMEFAREIPLASKVVDGLPKIHAKHEGVCKGCVKGKNTKKTFPSSKSKDKRILELIHSDVCGPMSSSSLSWYVYYFSFINDFSRKTWVYFLKNKDQVLDKFK